MDWWNSQAETSPGSWMRSVTDYQQEDNESTMFLAPAIDRHAKKKLPLGTDGKNRYDWMRRCTDICCIIPFVCFLAFWMWSAYYSFQHNDVKRLQHGTDYAGRLCGVHESVKAKPYLYYCPSTIDPTDVVTGGTLQRVDEGGKVQETVVGGGPAINKNVLAGFGVPYALNLAEPVCVSQCPDGKGAPDPCIAEFNSIQNITERERLLKTLPSPTKMAAYASKPIFADYCLPDLDFIAALAVTYEQSVPRGLRDSIEQGALGGDWKLKTSRSIGALGNDASQPFSQSWWVVVLCFAIPIIFTITYAYLSSENQVSCVSLSLCIIVVVFIIFGVSMVMFEFLSRPPERSLANRPAILDEDGVFNTTEKIERTFQETLRSFNDRWDGKEWRKFYEDNNAYYQDTISPAVSRTLSLITAIAVILCGLLLFPVYRYCSLSNSGRILQVSKKVFHETPLMWFWVPFISIILKSLVFFTSLLILTNLLACGKVANVTDKINDLDVVKRHYEFHTVRPLYLLEAWFAVDLELPGEVRIVLFLFGAFWMIETIQGMSQFVITYATIKWYFTTLKAPEGQKIPRWKPAGCCGSEYMCSWFVECSWFCWFNWGKGRTKSLTPQALNDAELIHGVKWQNPRVGYLYGVFYHLGSIAKGSFYIMIFRIAKFLLRVSHKFADETEGTCVGFISCVFKAGCTGIEEFLLMCDKDAYFGVALKSTDFFEGSEWVNEKFEEAGETVSSYRGACTIFTAVGCASVSIFSFFAVYIVSSLWPDLVTTSPLTVAGLAALYSAYISYEFVAMGDLASDAVLLSYIWNKYNGHASVQQYAPKELLDLMCYQALEKSQLKQGAVDLATLQKKPLSATFLTFLPGFQDTLPPEIERDMNWKMNRMEDGLAKTAFEDDVSYNLFTPEGRQHMWVEKTNVYFKGFFNVPEEESLEWEYWGTEAVPGAWLQKCDNNLDMPGGDAMLGALEKYLRKQLKIDVNKALSLVEKEMIQDRWNNRYTRHSAPLPLEFKPWDLLEPKEEQAIVSFFWNGTAPAAVPFQPPPWNAYCKHLQKLADGEMGAGGGAVVPPATIANQDKHAWYL